jgi:hypothetical protein
MKAFVLSGFLAQLIEHALQGIALSAADLDREIGWVLDRPAQSDLEEVDLALG